MVLLECETAEVVVVAVVVWSCDGVCWTYQLHQIALAVSTVDQARRYRANLSTTRTSRAQFMGQ